MKTMWVGALVLAMSVGVGCAVEAGDAGETEETTATDEQALGAGCTLLRPLGWHRAGTNCMESQFLNTPLQMVDGQEYFATGVPWGVIGEGWAVVRCVNGAIKKVASTCSPSSGSPL